MIAVTRERCRLDSCAVSWEYRSGRFVLSNQPAHSTRRYKYPNTHIRRGECKMAYLQPSRTPLRRPPMDIFGLEREKDYCASTGSASPPGPRTRVRSFLIRLSGASWRRETALCG